MKEKQTEKKTFERKTRRHKEKEYKERKIERERAEIGHTNKDKRRKKRTVVGDNVFF
jgi:hypothetical protein